MPSKSPQSRNVHEWKSTTAEGEKREIRAEKFGGRWRLQAKLKSEETWTYFDNPTIEDLAELREVLWRKYQRKKLPHEDLTTVERMIVERGGTVEPLH
ncbi:MAG: hypothetical protein ABMA13_04060 [Chthoniobacteraceae bacterium]